MKSILFLVMLFVCTVLFSQEVSRVSVDGVIIVKDTDCDGVTVFNTSSNKGTISNAKGEFKIDVALFETIEISALHLKPIKVTITKEVIETKILKVFMSEQVNSLDEVLLLPHNLTGVLEKDIENTEVVKPIPFSFGSFDDYEFAPDAQTGVENTVMNQGEIKYQLNFVAILSWASKKLFKNKKKDNKVYKNPRLEIPISPFSEHFPDDYFLQYFNISKEKLPDFIQFLEASEYNSELFQPKNEIKLIDFLRVQSELFLKQNHD